jgi:hypothetical protein
VEITSVELTGIVCARAVDWPAAEACCVALKAMPLTQLRAKRSSRVSLIGVWRKRAREAQRQGTSKVLGVERIVRDLESVESDTVTMVLVLGGDRAYAAILDESCTQLVACWVGRR